MASVRFTRNSLGAIGCTIGVTPQFGVLGYGADGADALHTAADLASKLAAIADQHKELSPLLSPDTVRALKALAAAAGIVKAGGDTDDITKQVGPIAAKVVGKLLSSWTGGIL